jgi:hypothetical protein
MGEEGEDAKRGALTPVGSLFGGEQDRQRATSPKDVRKRKKTRLTGPKLSFDARACDHRVVVAPRDSGALLRGPSEHAGHALGEIP